MTGASVLFVLGHFYLACLPQAGTGYEPLYRATFAFVLFGVAFSFYTTSIWPCVAYCLYIDERFRYVVDKKRLGSAYGLVIAAENAGLSLGPLLVSAFKAMSDYKEGYFPVSMLNMFEAVIGGCFAGYLLYYDYKHTQILMMDSKTAAEIQRLERMKPKQASPEKAALPAQIVI